MDKRLLIALLLVAIVVAITPIVFPTSRKPPPVSETVFGKDSVPEVPGISATAADSQAEVAPAERTDVPTEREIGTVVDAVALPAVTREPVRGELTNVQTARARYQFTNIGAAPVSVTMNDYQNLSRVKGIVDLKIPGRSLFKYSLSVGKDTIPMAGIPFQLSRSTSSAGAEVLAYQATIRGMGVAISYVINPQNYLSNVSGQVTGATGPAYLLIDMPPTLPIVESDTLSELRTLSFSFKPLRGNARGVPFGKLDPGERRLEAEPITWAAVRNKYFVIGLINSEGAAFEEMTFTGGARTSKVATRASAVLVKAVKNDKFSFDMYVGPQQSTQLLSVGRDFDHVNPYGWSILQPIVNPIAALCIKLLLWMHQNLHLSYGWVLVIFGVFIRVALWPLNQSAMRSSLKMQDIQPKLAEVQKKYKDKPERQREEMMKVYQEAGASPFTALSGCLPMLIPMPVLFALFFVFQNAIEFRGVPFMWLADISMKDPLYILPVLMGISMYVLTWIGMRNAPPNPQAKMMGYVFPVMMTFVLANMASGLNLYYTAQNIAALPQQWMIARERQKARRVT